MTVENHGSIWQFDHIISCSYFIFLDETQMRKCFNWINLCTRLIKDNASKGNKVDLRLYLLQQIEAHYFMKLNM